MMSWSHARVERRLGGMQLAQILYKRQDKTAQIHQHLPSTIYNELKHGKKSILAGQFTVCPKG